LFTKQRFLDSLAQPAEDWHLEEVVDLEAFKQRYKEAKSKKKDLAETLKSLVDELVANYENFKGMRNEYRNQIEEIKSMVAEAISEDDLEMSSKKARTGEATSTKLGSPAGAPMAAGRSQISDWCLSMSNIISKQNGIEVIAEGADRFVVKLIRSHTLEVQLQVESNSIASVQLIPNNVPISDIVEQADGTITNDIEWVVNQIKDRIWIFSKRQREIDLLKAKYKFNYDPCVPVITVSFPSGIIATLNIDVDYPEEWSRISVVRINGQTNIPGNDIEQFMEGINNGANLSLSSALERIEEFFCMKIAQSKGKLAI